MLPLDTLIWHSLIYGGILSVMMSAIILITLYYWPRIWVGSGPPELKAALGPPSPSDTRLKRLVALPTFLLVGGLLIHAIIRLGALSGGQLRFFDVALSTFLIIQVFSLVDLLLIDWLLIVTIRPRFVMIPGTEHLQSYGDYWFHFRGFLRGAVGSAIASLLIAAIAVGVARLAG